MIKKIFTLLLLSFSLHVFSQETLITLNNSLKTSSSDIKDIIPIVNEKTGGIGFFVADAKNVYGYKINANFLKCVFFFALAKPTTSRPGLVSPMSTCSRTFFTSLGHTNVKHSQHWVCETRKILGWGWTTAAMLFASVGTPYILRGATFGLGGNNITVHP